MQWPQTSHIAAVINALGSFDPKHRWCSQVVFEDAYGVWREDVNDVTPGKDKALFQVRARVARRLSLKFG